MKKLSDSRQFAADMHRFNEVMAFLESFCREAGASHRTCLRLTLVVEELFTNTVRHGYGGDREQPIWLSLNSRADEIELNYEDAAPMYNPFSAPPRSGEDQVGGWGVGLIKSMANYARYSRTGERNRICLTLAATGPDIS